MENNQATLTKCIKNTHKNKKLHKTSSKSHLVVQTKCPMKTFLQLLPVLKQKTKLIEEELRLDVEFTVSSQYITSHPVKGQSSQLPIFFQVSIALRRNHSFDCRELLFKTTVLHKKVSKWTCYKSYSDSPLLNNTSSLTVILDDLSFLCFML